MSASRNSVMNRSKVGKPVNSAGVRRYKITSSVRSESPMLTVRSKSSRNGGTGRINSRIVPKSPKISHKSPWRSSPRNLSLKETMSIV